MPIYFDSAVTALENVVASKINGTVAKAAQGIIRLVNNDMARAISMVSVERGRDPRDYSLIAFGGAGPIHCCDLAGELGISIIVVPVHAGLFSAYGLLTADLARTFTIPVMSSNPSLDPFFADLACTERRSLQEEGFSAFSTEEFVAVRYKGQSFELNSALQEGLGSQKGICSET